MSNPIKSQKASKPVKSSGSFTKPEEAAIAKNAKLVDHIRKIGLKVIKKDTPYNVFLIFATLQIFNPSI